MTTDHRNPRDQLDHPPDISPSTPADQVKPRPDDAAQDDLMSSLLDGVEPGTYVVASIEDVLTEIRGAWSRCLRRNPRVPVQFGRFYYELTRGLILDQSVQVVPPPQPDIVQVRQ